jgi:hypothetical protein
MPAEPSITDEDLEKRFLFYFERTVLCRYRASPDIYRLEEDDMGGVVSVEHADEDESSGAPRPRYFRVRFGFRRLVSARVVLAAFGPDLKSLSESEQAVWVADHLQDPQFQDDDPAFGRWRDRNLGGLWTSEDGPLRRLEREIDLVCALTNQTLERPLFRARRNPQLNYPVAENTAALAFAHLELFRLVVDGLDNRVIGALATRLGIGLSEPDRSLNSLKEALPEALHSEVHEPLRSCARVRNRLHGIASDPPRSAPAFDTFHGELEGMVAGLVRLKMWLEQTLDVRAAACLRREEAMNVGFPEYQGPPRPEMKYEKLTSFVGKTIERVDWGEVRQVEGVHQRESIVLHFTDGSAACIDVGSNAGNLESNFEGLRPEMFSTDLIITLAPSPRSEEEE